jgi:hypothetical protein
MREIPTAREVRLTATDNMRAKNQSVSARMVNRPRTLALLSLNGRELGAAGLSGADRGVEI